MKKAKIVLSLFLLTSSLSSQTLSPFSDGDRIVFLGNSITDGGRYHSFIWLYYMTRFPDKHITIYNAGIGGDRIVEMEKRLDEDVLSKQPTKLFLTFGMNDSGYGEYNTGNPNAIGDKIMAESYSNYQKMEDRLKPLSDIEITLLGSSPYDEQVVKETPAPFIGKHRTMRGIIDYQRLSAKKNGWQFFDFNQPMTELNLKLQHEDPSFSLSGFDRIHPDNVGHMIMAYLFLKAQGFSNRPVAEIGINAKNGRIQTAENCQITNVIFNEDHISFDYLCNSLPYPLDTVPLAGEYMTRQSDALSIIPFTKEMNSETLRVDRLEKGMYDLLIDDVLIGTWSDKEFADGINLATISSTPQYQQALAVMYLNEKRCQLERELRSYIWIQFYFFEKRGLLFADNEKALSILDKEIPNDIWLTNRRDQYALFMHPEIREAYQEQMELIVSKIYKINHPKTRRIYIGKK